MKLHEIKTIIRSRIQHNELALVTLANSLQLSTVRHTTEGENAGLRYVLELLADLEA